MRKESMFRTNQPLPPSSAKGVIMPATVKREIDKKKRELVPIPPSSKMLVALRKVLTKLSNDDEGGARFHISGNKISVIRAPQSQEVKEGDFANYSAEGYAKLGVNLRGGEVAYRFIHFSISFRDCLNENGLPDVEFFDPTELTEIDKHHPEVAGL